MIKLLILFVFISSSLCATIELKGSECIFFDPPNPCEVVSSVEFIGDFTLTNINLIGKLALKNGTNITINFKILGTLLGFLQSSEGIYRNGFTEAQGVSFCGPLVDPPPGTKWCNESCQSNPTCTPCTGCVATPFQSANGIDYCELSDATTVNTEGKIECQTSIGELVPLCCCFAAQAFFKRAACISFLNNTSPTGQSNSRIKIIRPEGFRGTGVMHVTSEIHDFFVLLSNNKQQEFPGIGGGGNTSVTVDQATQINPFIPTDVIGLDLAIQGPSSVNTYFIAVDKMFFNSLNINNFGPIRENPDNPNTVSSVIKPLLVTSLFIKNCCFGTYTTEVKNQDIKDLLTKDSDILLEFPSYTDKEKCKTIFNCQPPVNACINAFKKECFDGNIEADESVLLRINFGFRGVIIIGENPTKCDVTNAQLSNCDTNDITGNGECDLVQLSNGTGTVTYFSKIGSGGVVEKTFDCINILNGNIKIEDIPTTGVFNWCFYTALKVFRECKNQNTNFTLPPPEGAPTTSPPTGGAGGPGTKDGPIPDIVYIIAITIIVVLVVICILRIIVG